MTDQGDTTPAVWDPTARGGAGGWVRPRPADAPQGAAGPGSPLAPPPATGAVGDQGPPLAARPYLAGQAPAPGAFPDHAAPPPAPGGFPGHVTPPPAPGGFPGHVAPQQGSAPFSRPAPAVPPAPPQPQPPTGFPGHAGPQQQPPGPFGAPGAGAFDATQALPPVPPQELTSYQLRPPVPSYQPTAPGGYPPPPPQQAPGGYPPHPAPAGINLPGRYEEYQPEGPEQDDRPRRRGPLLVGIGVVLLLAIGGGTVFALQGSGSPAKTAKAAPPTATASPTGAPAAAPTTSGAPSGSAGASASPSASGSAGANALAEAQAMDALLTRGEAAKSPIGSAVAQVQSCPAKADIDSAAQTFDSAAQQRDQLLADLAKLNLADLPGGADAAAGLKTAWQESGEIDRSYAAWARTISAQGCGGGRTAPSTPDKQHADALNPQATQAKQDFVTKWNALATTYGLTPRTWDRI
ncbi:hypothetical protein ABH930_006264 [Kitasatospora sp. GAS204A]|uniref:hypothetical protein n=1 Tax=unclassified Kitasatospora TaxID=2633591 RepID=UPI0024769368|nr:hypothetical protein [Kitasatospora sp. GAS204B]MDH6115747.1 hypothetical protein [Kitasatospora sp. GAS204B]